MTAPARPTTPPPARVDDLIVATPRGLYCPPGDFHVDPWRPVDRAVITHAHGDHAHWGHRHYLATTQSAGVLRRRIPGLALQTVDKLNPLMKTVFNSLPSESEKAEDE